MNLVLLPCRAVAKKGLAAVPPMPAPAPPLQNGNSAENDLENRALLWLGVLSSPTSKALSDTPQKTLMCTQRPTCAPPLPTPQPF